MDYILNKLKMILIGQDKLKNNTHTNNNMNNNTYTHMNNNTNNNKTVDLHNFNVINNNNMVDNDKFTKPASYKNLNTSSSSYTD